MVKKSARKKVARISRPIANVNKTFSNSPKRTNRGLAIVCLLVNILLMPGLGTLIAGRTKEGVWQLVVLWIGIFLAIFLVGIPLIIIAWVWALISGIRIVQRSR